MAIKHITRKWYQNNMVLYYKHNDAILRYPTIKGLKPIDVNSRMRVKENRQNHEEMNRVIDELEERVDAAVTALLAQDHYIRITNKVMKQYLYPRRNSAVRKVKIEQTGVVVYDFELYIKEFNRRKIKEDEEIGVVRRGNVHPTTKDYTSAYNALLDYEHDYMQMLRLSDLTEEWANDFVDYLVAERHTAADGDYKYKTQGGLTNATINKRLDCIASFVKQHYQKEDVAKQILLAKQAKGQLHDIVCIDKDELTMLADMQLESLAECRVRDFFVFVCLTGLRYSDLIRIDRTHIQRKNKVPVLSLYTQKNRKFAEVPLVARAVEIAERYNYDFSYYTNPALNRALKNLFMKYHLFEDNFPKYRRIKKKIEKIPMLRRERLSVHAARRTFISILVQDNTPLNILMGYTGHSKVETLQHYIQTFSRQSTECINSLNI